jgi:glycosyltransferase involved in cell wall biosynthesis
LRKFGPRDIKAPSLLFMETPSGFRLSVVVPCHNEADNIPMLYSRLKAQLENFEDYELIFVDDGSTDPTASLIEDLAASDPRVRLLQLSRNFGHQNALKAGIDHADGDCIVSLDADLQHPPELIPQMVQRWMEGYDVVTTLRRQTEGEPFFKRLFSHLFYRLIHFLSDIDLPPGSADFRLIDRVVADVIKNMEESDIFLRGLISWAGFRQTSLEYNAAERFAGETSYNFRKMIKLALAGITSFSIRPLRLSVLLGIAIAGLAFLYGIYILYIYMFTDRAIPGWASTTGSILFIGGIQLIVLGIMGEYLGKLFMENKRRPQYIVRRERQKNIRFNSRNQNH